MRSIQVRSGLEIVLLSNDGSSSTEMMRRDFSRGEFGPKVTRSGTEQDVSVSALVRLTITRTFCFSINKPILSGPSQGPCGRLGRG
ncbi:hypothetical protein ABIE49_000033 [Bradyrhizobium sp. OAE829]